MVEVYNIGHCISLFICIYFMFMYVQQQLIKVVKVLLARVCYRGWVWVAVYIKIQYMYRYIKFTNFCYNVLIPLYESHREKSINCHSLCILQCIELSLTAAQRFSLTPLFLRGEIKCNLTGLSCFKFVYCLYDN